MNEKPWQLYDEQGRPKPGEGTHRDEAFTHGLLHAAAHVWIWRKNSGGQMEILLQKRLGKTWRGWHDISAAGHVDLGEDPLAAAIREVQEETSLIIEPGALWFAGVHRFSGAARPDGSGVKNELRFLYLLEVPGEAELAPGEGEVDSFKWLPLSIFKNEVTQKQGARNQARKYVPLGEDYFAMLIKSLETMNSGAVTD